MALPEINIDDLFNKYNEIIDLTITDYFGIDCQLVFIETIEEISNTYDNIPSNRSINAHRNTIDDYTRGNKTFKDVEVLETIRLKVYWDSRHWIKVGGDVVIPDTGIQTIFFATDLEKIMRAKFLIVSNEIKDKREYRFVKFGEPFPLGFRHNRYFGCFWQRAQ